MTFTDPIVAAGVAGLPVLFDAGGVTPDDALKVYLARIARHNTELGAVLEIDAQGAARDAAASTARWRAGAPLSPVDGAPLLIKANIAVAGLACHGGIGAYRDAVATTDAAAVAALRAAGAVILGSVNMHEGALGATTDNPWFGRCRNPWNLDLTAGGSSGGSGAAVAAGLCAAALGTDTMGSVRIPSAYCGVFGHKPARGAVATAGVMELSWTLDHVGVHARSAQDVGQVLAVLTGGAVEVLATVGLRIGVLDTSSLEMDPEVLSQFDRWIEMVQLEDCHIAPLRLEDLDLGALRRRGLLISEAEGSVIHEARLGEAPEGFSEGFRALLDYGARQPAIRLARAYRDLEAAGAKVREAVSRFDVVIAPTAPQASFPFAPVPANQADITALANFAGLPACAFPIGRTKDGRPLSAQALALSESAALSAALTLARPIGAPPGFTD